MTKPVPVSFTGGCACGAIRYEGCASPLRMVNCHCRDCQRASGSGYSATVFMAVDAVRVSRGATQSHQITAASGHSVKREFCGVCGTPLFASSSGRPEFIGVKAASLDDPSWFAPEVDVWVESAQPWDTLDPRIPKLAKGRPPAPSS